MRSVLRRTILILGLGAIAALVALASAGPARTSALNATCPATLVRHEPNPRLGTLSGGLWIEAKPSSSTLLGYLFGAHETDGRFALYTGVNPVNYTDPKVLWILDSNARAGAKLHVTGVQLALGPRGARRLEGRRFHASFSAAGSDQTPGILFPSVIHVPRPGCWRLALRTGHVSATVTVLVEPGACPASRVDGNVVRAGAITGGIDPRTDVVDGRFRLHVGEYRDVEAGEFQKILWSVPSNRRAGGQLVLRGRTILGPTRAFVQKFQYAGTDDQARRYFPSTVVPPSAGCWRLTLTTGKLHNSLVARVDD